MLTKLFSGSSMKITVEEKQTQSHEHGGNHISAACKVMCVPFKFEMINSA